ncbi:PEP-CTERM sorting domain-containing protein [Phragmitibacter flavus]|nr:PEP-CTERM sorting domain-containing protein [Phragmitibacter flavus]
MKSPLAHSAVMLVTLLLSLSAGLLPREVDAAYVLNQVGSGTATLTIAPPPASQTQASGTVNFAAITVNRSAPGFGDTTMNNPNVIEGAYYTYTFTAPGTANFDVQNQMGGLWSGWGSPNNGIFQNGPTTSSWARGLRYQHRYPDDTTSSFPVGSTVPNNTTLAVPTAGDILSVGIYLNAISNEIDYVYSNLTTGESFSYTFTNAGVPADNILSFNNIAFRSDSGITTFAYTYGTLAVVPEPGRISLLALALGICVLRRSRRR